MNVAQHIYRRFSYPAEKPIISISLYYVALIGLTALLIWLIPDLAQAFSAERLKDIMENGGNPVTQVPVDHPFDFSWRITWLLGVAMIGSFLLMLPASWVYMATRRKKGFDQSIVQTMLILALSVAGVVVIVRNSLALAFSLAGIVGAIRFRNTLPETRDTLYVFLAIGVGLAAGVEALGAAAVFSMIFNYVTLLMYRADYGVCELGTPAGHLRFTANGGAGPGATSEGKKPKARDFNAVLLVRAKGADQARPTVESFLAREVKRWRLAEVDTNSRNQEAVLKYLIRIGKKRDYASVEDAILEVGAPIVIGARIH